MRGQGPEPAPRSRDFSSSEAPVAQHGSASLARVAAGECAQSFIQGDNVSAPIGKHQCAFMRNRCVMSGAAGTSMTLRLRHSGFAAIGNGPENKPKFENKANLAAFAKNRLNDFNKIDRMPAVTYSHPAFQPKVRVFL
jgi:hypothetical protein